LLFGAVESIHARTLRHLIDEAGRQVSGQLVGADRCLHGGGEPVLGNFAQQLEPEVVQHPGIAQGAMTRAAVESVALHDRVQIVARVLGKQAPR
jgi:hypothetical protein